MPKTLDQPRFELCGPGPRDINKKGFSKTTGKSLRKVKQRLVEAWSITNWAIAVSYPEDVKTSPMKILLIDGNNYTYRGFYAIKEELQNADGIPTNAVRGFFTILHADLQVLKPTHLAVSFDRTPSYRRLELYPEYKSTRTHNEGHEVKPQMQIIRRLLRAMGIATLGIVGEETDDIIATLAMKMFQEEFNVLISSTDKDFAQLVNNRIKIVEARTRRLLGKREVQEKFGVKPSQIKDYLTLIGDSVDNVPGCKGIAGKTAAKLLNEYGDLNKIVKAAKRGELTPALTKNILHFKRSGQLDLSSRLIDLYTDVKLRFNVDRFDLAGRKIDHEKIENICDVLSMNNTEKLIWNINQWI